MRQGRTASLYDFMLDRYVTEEVREVALPDGTLHETRIVFMQNWVSYGWARYLTCGRSGAGGFADVDVLYVVADQYDLDSEAFQVGFLTHETQHFADYQRYPGMEQPELEYRAKLAELSRAEDALARTLQHFQHDQGEDRAIPHSYANRRVITDLRERLGVEPGVDLAGVDPTAVRRAAIALLREDSARRDAERSATETAP